jgi:hypothetical protein
LLDVHDNPGLDGCVPLSTAAAGSAEWFSLNRKNTHISGTCSTNATAAARAQLQVLRKVLPEVLVGTGTYAAQFNQLVQELLEGLSKLGAVVGDSEVQRSIATVFEGHYLRARVEAIQGLEYVTGIEYYSAASNADEAALHPALHLTYLAKLIKALPAVSIFGCHGCDGNPAPGNLQLLSALATTSLQTLSLPACGLIGTLPLQWGASRTLRSIDLSNNRITGTLPPSWAAGNLSEILLSNNTLRGTLPARWGQEKRMPQDLHLNVISNTQITGSIPPSWVHFASGYISLSETHVGGCLPDGLLIAHDKTLVQCSHVSPTAAALVKLRGMLVAPGFSAGPGLSTWVNGEQRFCSLR